MELVNSAEHRTRHNLRGSKVRQPRFGLRRGIVVEALHRVDSRIRNLALDRQDSVVPQTNDEIGFSRTQKRLSAELSRHGCLIQGFNRARLRLRQACRAESL